MNLKFITTSWDDGHPQDFRIAELLDKHRLQATFYIPRANPEHIVMQENRVQELSQKFEIGGHTINHLRLTPAERQNFEHEINGCYKWLKQITSTEPLSFCFPGGVYDDYSIEYVKRSGYKIFRTTELLSVEAIDELQLLPTTLQLYEHKKFTYFKHLLKRGKINNFVQWLQSGPTADLLKLVDYFIQVINKRGHGCLHVWGHSWEIEEFSLWSKLEQVLKHLSQQADFSFVPNKELYTKSSV